MCHTLLQSSWCIFMEGDEMNDEGFDDIPVKGGGLKQIGVAALVIIVVSACAAAIVFFSSPSSVHILPVM